MDDSSGATIARCQTLFEECQEAIAILTHEGCVLDVNQAGLDLFGYERKEIIGMDAAQVLYSSPDDLHRLQSDMEHRGSVKDYAMQSRRKDGKPNRQVCHTVPRGSYVLGKSENLSSWPDYESCTY
jgi:PAS domain S-box-containing protein